MGNEDRKPTTQQQPQAEADRYQPALAYVELDRTHRRRSRWSTILAVSVVVLAASLAMLGVIGFSYLQGQAKNSRIAEHADLTAISGDFTEENFAIDWDALKAENPDTVAWLYIPGTNINYPVVRGEDNDYYLSHDFTGEQGWLAQFGSIFLDWRNNPNWSDQAYFIYGHHMNDGSMFAGIARLADQARFDASRTVYLLSPNGNFKLKTFSLIHCPSDDPLVQITFSNTQEFASYIQDKMNRSIVNASDVPSADDIKKSFAFATCDNYSSGRYVLYAYVEQETGGGADVASNAAVKDGGAAGQINDIPADRSDEADSAQAEWQQERLSQMLDGESDEDEPYEDDGYYDEEEDAGGYYEDDGGGEGNGAVSVGDYEEYAGGYYIYDADGDLVWVSTEGE